MILHDIVVTSLQFLLIKAYQVTEKQFSISEQTLNTLVRFR